MTLSIRSDLSLAEVRARVRRLPSPRAAARALAVANALDRMTRAEAARLAGMERQALRDAVTRYNAEDLAGQEDRPKPGRPPGLTEGEEAALAGLILLGSELKRSGISSYTLKDIARLIEQHFRPSTIARRAVARHFDAWGSPSRWRGSCTRTPIRGRRRPG